MHYHVKSSTENALRDEEIHCVDGPEFAALALSQDLGQLSNWLVDGCDRGYCGCCRWCQASAKAGAARTGVMATRVAADLFGASEVIIDSPVGPDHAYILWMETVPGQRGTCNEG